MERDQEAETHTSWYKSLVIEGVESYANYMSPAIRAEITPMIPHLEVRDLYPKPTFLYGV